MDLTDVEGPEVAALSAVKRGRLLGFWMEQIVKWNSGDQTGWMERISGCC